MLIGNLLVTRNTWDSVVVCMSFGIHCWECHGKILTQFYYEGQEYYFLIIEGSFVHRFLMDQRFRESDFNY